MFRHPRPRLVLPAAMFLALVGAPAAAQVAPAPAASAPAAPPAGTFLLGAGVDGGAYDHVLGRWTPGVALQVGYERRVGGAGSRYALRLAGDYWRSGGNVLNAYTPTLPGAAPFRRSTRLYGANLLGVVQLRTRGAVRPYALAGAGVYQYVGVNETSGPGGGPQQVLLINGDRGTAFAATAGLGVSARVGPVTPFAELRLVNLLGAQTASTQPQRMPLTLGARLAF